MGVCFGLASKGKLAELSNPFDAGGTPMPEFWATRVGGACLLVGPYAPKLEFGGVSDLEEAKPELFPGEIVFPNPESAIEPD